MVNGNAGEYLTSFFEMRLKTDTRLFDLNQLNDAEWSAFLHEYTHFLQDISTISGLNNISLWKDYLIKIRNQLEMGDSAEFSVPVMLESNTDDVEYNFNRNNTALGDCTEIKQFDVDQIEENNVDEWHGDFLGEFRKIIIHTKNNESIEFGTKAIRESMAYLMEQLCAPSACGSLDDFPYNAAKKIADFYIPDFSNNKERLLALCDASLMLEYPGCFFVDTIKKIKNGFAIYNSAESIYQFFLNAKAEDAKGNKTTYIKYFEYTLKNVIQELKNYVDDSIPYKKSYNSWLNNLQSFILSWRKTDPYFLLKLAREGRVNGNKYLSRCLKTIGTPLITNNEMFFYKVQNTQTDVEVFKGIKQIKDLFDEGAVECALKGWCESSPKNVVDDKCDKCPWEKVNDEIGCPYSILWKQHGFMNFKPILS